MPSRSDPDTRQASLLLSGLVLTPDDALEVFRDRRAADKSLELEHLKRARDVLDFVHLAIIEAEPQRWQRLEEVWGLLNQPLDAAPSTPATTMSGDDDGGPAPPARLDSSPPQSEHAITTSDEDPTKQVAPISNSPSPPATVGLPPPSAPGRMPAMPAPAVAPPARGSSSVASSSSPWSKATPAPPPPAPAAMVPSVSAATPPSAAPPPAASSSVSVEQLDRIQRAQRLSSTLDEPLEPRIDVMPFKGKVAQPPPSAVKARDDDPLMQTAYIESTRTPATTLPFKAVPSRPDAPSADKDGPAQYAPALPAHLTAIGIEKYAALCAECAVHSRWAKEIAARYGVSSEAERQALDAHFRAKMADDPKLAETWRYHYARVEQWARQQKS